jgi:hypothetical protein
MSYKYSFHFVPLGCHTINMRSFLFRFPIDGENVGKLPLAFPQSRSHSACAWEKILLCLSILIYLCRECENTFVVAAVMSLSAWCTVEHCIYIRTRNTTSNRQLKVVKLLAASYGNGQVLSWGFRQIQKPIVQVSHSLWSKIRVVSDKNTTQLCL